MLYAPKKIKLNILGHISFGILPLSKHPYTLYMHVCDKENDFLQENFVNNTQHGSFQYKRGNLLTRFMYVRLSLYVSLAKSVRKCWLTSVLA